MKKLGIMLSILVALAIIGCASSGGSSAASGGNVEPPYSVDLNTLTAYLMEGNAVSSNPSGEKVRNRDPFVRNYDNLPILFPELPVDITKYSRATIRAKYFDEANNEIMQGDGNAMVSLFYDHKGEIFADGSSNVFLKEFNVGGFSGIVSTDKGVRIRPTRNPGGILLQNSNIGVKYIELTEVTFHNSTASAKGSADASPAAAVGADAPVGVAAAVAAIPDDGKPKIAVYVTSSDRSIAARALSGLGAFNTVGDGLAKAISETEKGHGVNLTNEITKAYGANVGISQANAVGQTYGVQYLCVVTISNVKGKAFNLGIDIVDVSKSQKTASSSGAVDMGNPVGMLQNIGKMSLDISSGIALNAVLN